MTGEMSDRRGVLADYEVVRSKYVLDSAHIPVEIPKQLSAEQMLDLRSLDKRGQAGKLNLIVLTKSG